MGVTVYSQRRYATDYLHQSHLALVSSRKTRPGAGHGTGGHRIGGAVAKLLAESLINAYGWRTAYVGIGFLPLVVALPIALIAFHDVDDPKVAKRAAGLAELGRETGTMIKQYGFTFAQAIRDWRLWLLGAIFLPLSFAIGGPIPNL